MLAREKVLESLLELTNRSTDSRAELLDKVLHTALVLAECDGAALLTGHNRRCERQALERGQARSRIVETARVGSDFMRILLRRGQPLPIADVAADPRIGVDDRCPSLDAGPALFVPLRLREHAPGYLAVYRRRGAEGFSPDDARHATLLAAWTALALENRRLSESLEKLAVTDDLTQVYNYRFLKTALRRELKRAGRFNQQLSLVMIDVDNLKSYNDRNGHTRGSFLLKEVAGLFAQHVRSFDLLAKYGGDEFTLILPQTGLDGACVVAERMRRVVEGHAFPLVRAGEITVSLGVAIFPEDAGDPMGLIQAADRALYVAKQHGRNRVEVCQERAA